MQNFLQVPEKGVDDYILVNALRPISSESNLAYVVLTNDAILNWALYADLCDGGGATK